MHYSLALIVLTVAIPFFARAETTIGNQFLIGAHPESVPVQEDLARSARFTATKAAPVTAVLVKLREATASALTLSIQADDGRGHPDGKDITSGKILSPTEGWNHTALPQTDLKEDAVYHLVMTVEGPGEVGWLRINSVTHGTQPSGNLDPQWASGTDRSDRRSSWIFVLETGTDINFGQPYLARINTQTVSTVHIPAQRFVFRPPESGESTAAAVSLYLSAGDEAPAGEYTLALLDAKNRVLSTTQIPSGEIDNGTTQFHTFPFPEKPTLTPGAVYSVVFYNDSPAGRVMWVSEASDAGEALEKATWQGAEGRTVFFDDPSLQSIKTEEPGRDFVFSLTLE